MSELNWHTDEDGDWDDLTAPTKSTTTTPENEPHTAVSITPRQMILRSLFLILSLIAIWQLYTTFQSRVESNIALIEADIITSHGLIYEAILRQDQELMANLLSGRDMSWVQTQIELIGEGFFFGRSQFGLHQLTELPPQVEIVELSPDLATATITIALSYQTDTIATPIVLEHTAVYKLGMERWLLAPADPLEDPQVETYQGEYIIAIYPQEEEELISRLVTDMDQTMRDVCNRFVDLMCSPTTHQFNLVFSSDSAALQATLNPQTAGIDTITLPSPALLGRPVTDQGYRTLYQAYAFYLAPELLDQTLREDWAMAPEQGG